MNNEQISHRHKVGDFDRAVLVRHIRGGQPRPYADSVYESEIIFAGKNGSTKPESYTSVLGSCPHRDVVAAIAKVLVHEFQEGESDNPFGSQLQTLECVEKGDGFSRWRVIVVVPYCD